MRGLISAAFRALLLLCCLFLNGGVKSFAQDLLRLSLSEEIEFLQDELSFASNPIELADYETLPLPAPPFATSSDSKILPSKSAERYDSSFDAGYDRGLFFRVDDGENESFELKTNLRTQFRISGFDSVVDSWTDNANVTRPVKSRQNFDIERARLIFQGHAFTPELTYFLQMDGDTDRGHFVTFFDYFWSWHFSDEWEVQFGKRKVSGGRNWLLGAFDTRLADRPYTLDFFRPGRTVGVWMVGEPTENTYYELMAGAGYRTDNLTPLETNDDFAFASTGWWDVVGDYGPSGPVDFEFHDDPAVRLGYSWVSSKQGDQGRQLPESDFLRLSDGTRITQIGALEPGVTVETFDITLLGLDAAFKHEGWSLNSEYFWRWLSDIKGDMPIANKMLFQHGFYVEGGYFVLPQKLELNAHLGQVSGEFGSSFSYAAGFSCYPNETKNLKFTLDATSINGSPVNSTGSDILVGDDGVLVRFQIQALF